MEDVHPRRRNDSIVNVTYDGYDGGNCNDSYVIHACVGSQDGHDMNHCYQRYDDEDGGYFGNDIGNCDDVNACYYALNDQFRLLHGDVDCNLQDAYELSCYETQRVVIEYYAYYETRVNGGFGNGNVKFRDGNHYGGFGHGMALYDVYDSY
eukprot:TRINITY_DN5835_c1_g1_i3.p3 TRINITY_DN5835_c1_g1~~TRINITY_DN5835_c1_g1_i3.p3  ORF type:complete len:151 (-),score=13.00 TRINITY_DN5835_c1_g1_i3:100-552(-)